MAWLHFGYTGAYLYAGGSQDPMDHFTYDALPVELVSRDGCYFASQCVHRTVRTIRVPEVSPVSWSSPGQIYLLLLEPGVLPVSYWFLYRKHYLHYCCTKGIHGVGAKEPQQSEQAQPRNPGNIPVVCFATRGPSARAVCRTRYMSPVREEYILIRSTL